MPARRGKGDLALDCLLPGLPALVADHDLVDRDAAVIEHDALHDVQEAHRDRDLGRLADQHLALHDRGVIGVRGAVGGRIDAPEGEPALVLQRAAAVGP